MNDEKVIEILSQSNREIYEIVRDELYEDEEDKIRLENIAKATAIAIKRMKEKPKLEVMKTKGRCKHIRNLREGATIIYNHSTQEIILPACVFVKESEPELKLEPLGGKFAL